MKYQSQWFHLYRRAVLENDAYRVNARVDAASQCIQERLGEPDVQPDELLDLQRCLHYLTILRLSEIISRTASETTNGCR